jgi:hypothetical protein
MLSNQKQIKKKKNKLFIYKNIIILLDGSYIKYRSIKFLKKNQINFNFYKKNI